MSNTYWARIRAALRNYMYEESTYHKLNKIGLELGEKNEPIPMEKLKGEIKLSAPKQADYFLKAICRGYAKGLGLWKRNLLQEHRKDFHELSINR
jgi:hypothetical protein